MTSLLDFSMVSDSSSAQIEFKSLTMLNPVHIVSKPRLFHIFERWVLVFLISHDAVKDPNHVESGVHIVSKTRLFHILRGGFWSLLFPTTQLKTLPMFNPEST